MILCYNSKCVGVFWIVSLLPDSLNEFSVKVYVLCNILQIEIFDFESFKFLN